MSALMMTGPELARRATSARSLRTSWEERAGGRAASWTSGSVTATQTERQPVSSRSWGSVREGRGGRERRSAQMIGTGRNGGVRREMSSIVELAAESRPSRGSTRPSLISHNMSVATPDPTDRLPCADTHARRGAQGERKGTHPRVFTDTSRELSSTDDSHASPRPISEPCADAVDMTWSSCHVSTEGGEVLRVVELSSSLTSVAGLTADRLGCQRRVGSLGRIRVRRWRRGWRGQGLGCCPEGGEGGEVEGVEAGSGRVGSSSLSTCRSLTV